VKGQTEVNAIKLLADQRLRVGNVQRSLVGAGAAGTILDQNPRATLEVARDTQVDLVIKEDGVAVPAVKNRVIGEVSTTLLSSGLTYKLQWQLDRSRLRGTIVNLSPDAGQLVPRNSEVTLTLTKQMPFEGVLVQEIEGLTRATTPGGLRIIK
jgi:beta-lactam-binding protein with PASTA domain